VTPRAANLATGFALLGLLVALAFTAPRWARLMRQPVAAPSEEDAASAAPGAAKAASPEAEAERTISVKLYFESPDVSGLLPEDRSLPFSVELSRQLRTVVEELVRGSTTGLASALPADTKVLDVFVTARGVAFVSLSKEAAAGVTGGSTSELLTVYSVVNSITANFPAVKRVQLLLDDRPVVTFAGHVDVSRPLPPDMTFVAFAAAGPSPRPDAVMAGPPATP
jgi:spore germination protein GerM